MTVMRLGRRFVQRDWIVVSSNVALQVATSIAGEVTVAARVGFDARVDPQVASEGGTAGEVSATRLTEGRRGRYKGVNATAHLSGSPL